MLKIKVQSKTLKSMTSIFETNFETDLKLVYVGPHMLHPAFYLGSAPS